MSKEDDGIFTATPMTDSDRDNPTIAMVIPGELPEKIIVNGVTYLRQSDEIDATANLIWKYKEIALRGDVSLAQAVWFHAIATNGNWPGPTPD